MPLLVKRSREDPVGKAQAPSDLLMKLARTTPYYKRNRPHIYACSGSRENVPEEKSVRIGGWRERWRKGLEGGMEMFVQV